MEVDEEKNHLWDNAALNEKDHVNWTYGDGTKRKINASYSLENGYILALTDYKLWEIVMPTDDSKIISHETLFYLAYIADKEQIVLRVDADAINLEDKRLVPFFKVGFEFLPNIKDGHRCERKPCKGDVLELYADMQENCDVPGKECEDTERRAKDNADVFGGDSCIVSRDGYAFRYYNYNSWNPQFYGLVCSKNISTAPRDVAAYFGDILGVSEERMKTVLIDYLNEPQKYIALQEKILARVGVGGADMKQIIKDFGNKNIQFLQHGRGIQSWKTMYEDYIIQIPGHDDITMYPAITINDVTMKRDFHNKVDYYDLGGIFSNEPSKGELPNIMPFWEDCYCEENEIPSDEFLTSPRLWLRSTRPIKKGEPLLWCYGNEYEDRNYKISDKCDEIEIDDGKEFPKRVIDHMILALILDLKHNLKKLQDEESSFPRLMGPADVAEAIIKSQNNHNPFVYVVNLDT